MRRRKILLADSSSLVALDRLGKLATLRGLLVYVPPAVKEEIVEKARAVRPDSPAFAEALASANRFQYYLDLGTLRIVEIDYVEYGKVLDQARKRLAKLEGSREDRVPKADVQMAAGIAQLLDEREAFQVLCENGTRAVGRV